MRHYKNIRHSRSRGVAALELAIGSFLMIAISALAMNLSLLILATTINDAVCRDAARAAAQTNNQAAAILAATSQLNMHSTDGYFVSQPTLTSTSSPYFVYNDFTGAPPANTSPYVTVTTQVTVKVPAPIFFFGASFFSKTNNTLLVQRRYTFPIIKEKFYG